MRRFALTLLLAMLPAACGLSAARVEDGATATEPAPATTAGAGPTTLGGPATTAPPATPAPSEQDEDSEAPKETIEVAPYFLIDEAGRSNRTGPFLLPVARQVESTRAVARAAMEQLLSGPSREERDGVPSISSSIPEGVKLLGITIEDGLAAIDLSSEFEIGDDSAAVTTRIAQVVFTLTNFDSVERVRFLQDGEEVKVPIGDGSLVEGAVTRGDYLDFAAGISVESPHYGGTVSGPLRVTGFAAVFEATFRYALTDWDGVIIEEGQAMSSNGTGWGSFDFTIDYDIDSAQRGALIVWAHSAKDGSRIDVREYPLALQP